MNRQALQYVKNTNGGASIANFCEDLEPVGEMIWDQLLAAGLVDVDSNARIHLTVAGEAELAA